MAKLNSTLENNNDSLPNINLPESIINAYGANGKGNQLCSGRNEEGEFIMR